jgi:hypothetical protein
VDKFNKILNPFSVDHDDELFKIQDYLLESLKKQCINHMFPFLITTFDTGLNT